MAANRESSRVLGPLEADVMAILWSTDEPLNVRQVLESLNTGRTPELAYTTVMTVLSRLADKEILRRERDGKGYRYTPIIGDQAGIAVRGVLRDHGEAAVAGFVDEARADPKLLRRLRAVLDEEDR